jgi:hypothetical protein
MFSTKEWFRAQVSTVMQMHRFWVSVSYLQFSLNYLMVHKQQRECAKELNYKMKVTCTALNYAYIFIL